MGYLIDRREAFRTAELVMVLNERRRSARSRVMLRDGSLHTTRTRPATFVNTGRGAVGGVCAVSPQWTRAASSTTSGRARRALGIPRQSRWLALQRSVHA